MDAQRIKLEHYLADHFSDDFLRHEYLATLWKVSHCRMPSVVVVVVVVVVVAVAAAAAAAAAAVQVRTDPGKVWKVLEFNVQIFKAWKSLENDHRYGKVWKNP